MDVNLEALEVPNLKQINAWKNAPLQEGDIVLIAWPSGIDLLDHVFSSLYLGYVPMLVPASTPQNRLIIIARNVNAKAILLIKPKGDIKNIGTINSFSNGYLICLSCDTKGASSGEIILSTSGTSGMSSGCVFKINSLITNAIMHLKEIGLNNDDIILAALPFHYSYAFVAQAIASYVIKSKLISLSPPVSTSNIVKAIDKYKVTSVSLTPLLARSMMDIRFPKSLRTLTIGGDSIMPHEIEKLLLNNPNLKVFITYGLTEAGPRVSTLAAHNESYERFKSVGKPLAGVSATIINNNSHGNRGELLISSPTLMKRKIKDANSTFSDDWKFNNALRTGDIFEIDKDDYLYFKGRIKDFIVRNGEKINLHSIKQLLKMKFGGIPIRICVKGNKYGIYITENNQNNIIVDVNNYLSKNLRNAEMPNWIDFEKSGFIYK